MTTTFEDYCNLSKNTQRYQVNHVSPAQAAQLNYSLGLCGQAGQVSQLIKKRVFHLKQDDAFYQKLQSELGDVLWYWMALCRQYSIDPSKVMETNLAKLRERYPANFQ